MIDIVPHICSFLNNYDKIQYLSTNKWYYDFRENIFFEESVYIDDIHHLWYFDSFINIITNDIQSFPKFTKYLTFDYLFEEHIENYIPLTVTHLHFDCNLFYQGKDNVLPPNTTHLIFDCEFAHDDDRYGMVVAFNDNIPLNIPSSVTHLTFGKVYNKRIAKHVPDSATHLSFGNTFNQDITGCIGSNITHLYFGYQFKHELNYIIPITIKHITLSKNYNLNLCKHLKCTIDFY